MVAKLSGTVIDINKVPVSSVSVILDNKPILMTNNKGYYEMHPSAGNRVIVFSHSGYQLNTNKVKVGTKDIVLNATLLPVNSVVQFGVNSLTWSTSPLIQFGVNSLTW